MPATKALIAGLSAIHSAGIATLLKQLAEDLDTHEVDSPEQALDFVLQTRDVALVVLDLPSYDGQALYYLKLVSDAADPAPVLAIANFRGRRDAVRALESGAMVCLNRAASGKETLTALQRLLDGDLWVSSRLLAQDNDRRAPAPTSPGLTPICPAGQRGGADRLSRQQLEILEHLRDGKTNRQIARLIDMSPHTVRYHVSAILRALDVGNRTEAAMRADSVIRLHKEA